MRNFIILSSVLLTLACNMPGLGHRDQPATRVVVDGSAFDVRVTGNRAEAIRVNTQYAPRFGPIRARAGQAMARASGCEVVEVSGDQAQAFGRLDCGKGAPPPRPVPQGAVCEPIRGTAVKGLGETTVELDCTPV